MHGHAEPIPSPTASGIEKGSRQVEKHGAMPTCDDYRREFLLTQQYEGRRYMYARCDRFTISRATPPE